MNWVAFTLPKITFFVPAKPASRVAAAVEHNLSNQGVCQRVQEPQVNSRKSLMVQSLRTHRAVFRSASIVETLSGCESYELFRQCVKRSIGAGDVDDIAHNYR